MYSRNYGLQKMWLDNCLKSPVPERLSRRNKVSGPKHCWNLKDRSFTIFIDKCECN